MAAHTAADVRSLCEAYLEAARQVERTHRPLDGMFGFGQKTADAPCHSRFLSDLEALLGEPVYLDL